MIAIAVAYRGKRLGAWWSDDWWHHVRCLVRENSALQVAMLMRWFQLPILQPRVVTELRALVHDNGLDFATAWLAWADRDHYQPLTATDRIDVMDHLRPPLWNSAWHEVMRDLLSGWQPTTSDAERLASKIDSASCEGAETTPLPMENAIRQVASVTPLLAARIMSQWLTGKPEFAHQARHLLDAISDRIKPPSEPLPKQDDALLRSGYEIDPRVSGLELSPTFVDDILRHASEKCRDDQAIDRQQDINLVTLLQNTKFAQLVTAHLLKSIDPNNLNNHVTT